MVATLAGVPEARRAAAEALTNMASTTQLTPASGGGGAAVNIKVEVQRAGALPALMHMLQMKDEKCVQAAANALYVLAGSEENRQVMQGAGVRPALQAVLAKGKLRPPQIGARTRRDCEDAIARMLG